jgi:hypothetical protein
LAWEQKQEYSTKDQKQFKSFMNLLTGKQKPLLTSDGTRAHPNFLKSGELSTLTLSRLIQSRESSTPSMDSRSTLTSISRLHYQVVDT